MGENLQQMLGLFLIALLLMFCDSFPQINERNFLSTDKQNKFMIEEVFSELKGTDLGYEGDEVKLSPGDIGHEHLYGARSLPDKPISQKMLRTVRQFTENTVASVLKFYLLNKRKLKNKNVDASDVILHSSRASIMQNNKTANLAKTIPSALATKYNAIIKKDTYTHNSDIIKNTESKMDRWLPGLRRYRRRRSFLSGFGFEFESAFEDDNDVVFGAHTSACDRSDRHYCLNGGTCVYLGALEVKTCRCKIGYTGLRCEMINQEFLLALLSEEFFG